MFHWQNLEDYSQFKRRQSPIDVASLIEVSPSKRWGHTSVEALDRLFIIGGYQGKSTLKLTFAGQYLGDVWMYDFRELKYSEVKFTEGDDSSLLARSNHTSVFYKAHNR
jgi:hypothetical protein